MPRWLDAARTRLPRATLIWAGLALLMAFGLATTLVDLAARPGEELRLANSNGQRVIIDPFTGSIAGTARSETPAAFEVSEESETPEEASSIPEEAPMVDGAPADAPALRTEAKDTALPSLSASRDSLVLPPAPEITELGKLPLPKRGDKGATPAGLYAKRFQRQEEFSYITLLLIDAGFSTTTLTQILTLPREVTVALSPYALESTEQVSLLHTAGYETWGMLPSESARYPQDDPGPLGLVRGQDGKEQLARLKQVMGATLGAVGLVLSPGDVFSESAEFADVLKEIDGRGLLVLSTHPTRTIEQLTSDATLAEQIRRADAIIDATESAAFITSKLASLPELARQQKKLIVVATARPHTLDLIAEWLKTEPLGEDIKLAPLSAMFGSDTPPPPPEPPADAGGHGGGAKKESSGGHGGGH